MLLELQPDCLSIVTAFLEPHELRALRCVSMLMKTKITDKMKQATIINTYAKYCRAVRMPDGAIRIHTRLGRQRFDMYTLPIAVNYETGMLTPVYVLKQEGMPDKIGHIDNVWLPDAKLREHMFLKGNTALLEAPEMCITTVDRKWNGTRESTAICLEIYMPIENSTDEHIITLNYEFNANTSDEPPDAGTWQMDWDPK